MTLLDHLSRFWLNRSYRVLSIRIAASRDELDYLGWWQSNDPYNQTLQGDILYEEARLRALEMERDEVRVELAVLNAS